MVGVLKNIAKVTAGNSAPQKDKFSDEGIPFIRAGSLEFLVRGIPIDECEKIDPLFAKEKKMRLFPKGSILFAKSGMSSKMGRVYVLPEDAYIVSHLAVVTITSKHVNNEYVAFYFNYRPPYHLIKDDAYPSISVTDIENVEIPLPDLETQNKIVAILDKAKAILDKRAETITKYDELLRATFLEMFGDVSNNPKGFDKKPLKDFGQIITGNTPPRKDKSNYDSNFIEWIKTDNITSQSHFLTHASEYLSETGFAKSRYVNENALLVACIAGSISSIGRSAITDRRVAFNQQINAVVPAKDVSIFFLYWMFKVSAEYVQSYATGGMKRLLTKGEFQKVPFIKPDYNEQLQFEEIAKNYSVFQQKLLQHQTQSENLLKSLSQQVFNERIIVDVDAELEALINSIDLDKNDEENMISSVVNDITFIQRLIDRLNEQEFEDKSQYDKAKYILFKVMKEEENLVKQLFKDNKIQLTLQNETT
ncbi:restriction endonuclease subunit S [Gillisia sp. JM1]|uniref:restriction endonuclease subunit S n=1 Tax=Gillisia sp. JM1 TaxID=1283286 RepID=UPI000416A429|nr:restriction endonuclease subunit S [Gillisia sp. JM1]